ncbi:kinetochore protein SPC24 homolog isoform X1 [Coffea eugenioides]|uniref:kinetochore protein SPC24 homolog isoform X1 n=1 Tax=Coffea eugenioides TaxID=49369 RepID=UPI000F60A3AB|nr:kinetochore protein SPC24 homolog isoform X1 [Coffea eugenioides]
MADSTRFEVEKLIAYSHELVDFLRDDGDNITLKQYFQQAQSLHSRAHADFNGLQRSIQECQTKLEICRSKTTEANSTVVADEESDLLAKELEEREHQLRDELRVIIDEINNLEQQSESIEERRKSLKKLEQEDLRREMKLSMYASVTSIVPNLDDQSKISGHIVEREEKRVEKFELDPVKQTTFETCNGIWKMINL